MIGGNGGAQTLLAAGLYKPLLAWAEQYALVCNGICAPWKPAAPAAPAQSPKSAVEVVGKNYLTVPSWSGLSVVMSGRVLS